MGGMVVLLSASLKYPHSLFLQCCDIVFHVTLLLFRHFFSLKLVAFDSESIYWNKFVLKVNSGQVSLIVLEGFQFQVVNYKSLFISQNMFPNMLTFCKSGVTQLGYKVDPFSSPD